MRILVVAATCMITASAVGQEPVEEKRLHQPGVMPDRVVLTWAKDPARSQSVTWRTDTSVTKAVAEFAEATAGPEFVDGKKTKTVNASTSAFKSDLNEAQFHSAHFEDLSPGVKYVYRVGDGVNWSEWNHFTTASDRPAPFTFLYFGDAQHRIKEHCSRIFREAYAHAPRARFAIHAGDLINTADRDAEWGEWFQAGEWIHRTLPVVPTPGNHEYRGNDGKTLPAYWKKQFALPENGPTGLVGGVYYLDFQGARIVSLNSNEKHAEQAAWLDRVLADRPQRWTIVTFHHPIYSSASGRDNPELRKAWQPIFDRHRVDLVLQGHDHSYGRSGLEGFEGKPGGTVYVVSVSGPMFYTVDAERWMVRKAQRKQLFQAITIDGDRLHYEARTAAGELLDSFDLMKQDGNRPNQLKDGPFDARADRVAAPTQGNWLVPIAVVLMAVLVLALRLLRKH